MPAQTTPGLPDPAAAIRFATALAKAPGLAELERVFTAGFGRVVGVPMYGFYALEPGQQRIERNVAVNVSDVFVARYDRVMERDPLLERSRSTGRTAYNLAIMSAAEWEESAAYRLAYSTHRMRHVAEIPVTAGGHVLGALHFAASDPAREFAPADLRLAEAIGDALGQAIARIQAARRGEAERERGRLAVELAGIAVVVSQPGLLDLQLNDAARALLQGIVDGDEHVHRLVTGPAGAGRFSSGVPVELATGASGTLHAHAERMPDGALVTVLELRGEQPGLAGRFLRSLTPREAEVAGLVVEGLTDREIARRLLLSPYTVMQHVKSVYRKLGVDSRVALTRLLTGASPGPGMR
jgi:DNA-binding CsgD family transcriptional regulator